jgi:protein tyrosine phosphatase (PTP) superfamily phosphohydrolase (DUF442 family)
MPHALKRLRRETDELYTADQPAADDFETLRAEGFEVVVNISTPTARNFVHDESARVLAAGMTYVHAPVDCARLTPDHYAMVSGVLRSFRGKKVLLHCAGNVKASAFAHLFRVKDLGEPIAELRAELREADWHEAKWYAYFDAMGAQG